MRLRASPEPETGRGRCGSALSIWLSDDCPDGAWSLRVRAEGPLGWVDLGQVVTFSPRLTGGAMARLVATAAVPGARAWEVEVAATDPAASWTGSLELATAEVVGASALAGVAGYSALRTAPLAARFVVGLSAAPLSGAFPRGAVLLNNGAATIYLGGPGLTTADGFPLSAGASLSDRRLQDLSSLWAVSGTAGQDLRALGLT